MRRAVGRSRSSRFAGLAGSALVACLCVVSLSSGEVPTDPPPFEVAPAGHMKMLFERTFLKVNVMHLEVFVEPSGAEKIGALIEGKEKYSDELAKAVADVVVETPQVFVRMEFLRGVSQKQFFKSIKKNMKKTLEAGWIDEAYLEETLGMLPTWYGFMEQRGIKKGDWMVYWVHGDTLDSSYHGVEGEVLLDRNQTGSMRRYGVLGSYFAPKSDFRKKLVKSLMEGE